MRRLIFGTVLMMMVGSSVSWAATHDRSALAYGHYYFGAEIGGEYYNIQPEDLRARYHEITREQPDQQVFSASMGEHNIAGSLSLFFERAIRKGLSAGLSAGVGRTSSAELSATYNHQGDNYKEEFKLDAIEVPLTLYFRQTLRERWGILLGGGASYIRARVEDHWESWGVAGFTPFSRRFDCTFYDETWSPHLLLKGEYFILKSLSINLNFRYLFSAKLDHFTGEGRDTAFKISSEYTLYRYYDTILAVNPSDLYTLPSHNIRYFEQDYSGPRFGVGLRYYFGGGVP